MHKEKDMASDEDHKEFPLLCGSILPSPDLKKEFFFKRG